MPIANKQTRLINDLILINNDRVVGYQKAVEELNEKDADLKLLFKEMKNQSEKYISELTEEVIKAGYKVEKGTTNAGKIYRVWMDVKAFLGGFDRKVVLDNCEDGEDAALTAYNDALASEGLTPDVRSLLSQHHAELKVSYNRVKELKNAKE